MTIEINPYFLLGEIFLTGAVVCLLCAYCRAWFEGKRSFWRFFVTKISHDDPELQGWVRGFFLGGMILALIGAIIVTQSNPSIPKEFFVKLLNVIYLMGVVWVLAKAVLLGAIIVHKIGQWITGSPKEQNLAD